MQAYFGVGLHVLGLLEWLLPQTGRADVAVSSFSTSEPFLRGFWLCRRRGLVNRCSILLDERAALKTLRLRSLLLHAFDDVYLGMNHSKMLLVRGEHAVVSVVTSQNQTYGDRAESTVITTSVDVYDTLQGCFDDIIKNKTVKIDLNERRTITADRELCSSSDASAPDWRPFAY